MWRQTLCLTLNYVIMAIVTSMWLKGTKQKLGGSVLYQAMGQTRQRELAANVANPRTNSQMEQRTRWANLVNFYRVNSGWMKFAYETKKTNQSEYNKFMSLNVPGARIYLPKSIASQGGCVVDAYQMTQGSLASIEALKSGADWQTNLYLASITDLDENSTVGEVTAQLLPANPALREGDQISFLRFTQMTNSSTGVPFVVVRKYEVLLKANDTRRFFDFMPMEYITFGGTAQVPCIEVVNSGNAGGFLLVLSRTIGGKTFVSSQSIVVANNEAMISAYSSDTARQKAIDSYGESAEPFLTSSTANEDSQAATRLSILGVKINGVTYTPGTRVVVPRLAEGVEVDAIFNQKLPEGAGQIGSISWWKNGNPVKQSLEIDAVTGNTAEFLFPDAPAVEDIILDEVDVSINDEPYRAVFLVFNSDTISGLE